MAGSRSEGLDRPHADRRVRLPDRPRHRPPRRPRRYLAGVECDGATYHSSATARDRDRLREHVLTDLGWRIRRVWSTEWWMDAEGALAKLDQRLSRTSKPIGRRRRRNAAAPSDVAVDPRRSSRSVTSRRGAEVAPSIDEMPSEPANDFEPVTDAIPQRLYADQVVPVTPRPRRPEVDDDVRAYRIADLNDLGRSVEPGRFSYASYRQALSAMIDHVLAVEGPIYEELAHHRASPALTDQRVGHSSGRRSPTGSMPRSPEPRMTDGLSSGRVARSPARAILTGRPAQPSAVMSTRRCRNSSGLR